MRIHVFFAPHHCGLSSRVVAPSLESFASGEAGQLTLQSRVLLLSEILKASFAWRALTGCYRLPLQISPRKMHLDFTERKWL